MKTSSIYIVNFECKDMTMFNQSCHCVRTGARTFPPADEDTFRRHISKTHFCQGRYVNEDAKTHFEDTLNEDEFPPKTNYPAKTHFEDTLNEDEFPPEDELPHEDKFRRHIKRRRISPRRRITQRRHISKTH